jgi:hypothetical protein
LQTCSSSTATGHAAPPRWFAATPALGLIACPRCAKTMVQRHYSYSDAVEIDYCSICDLFWFEKDELETLQILAERQAG